MGLLKLIFGWPVLPVRGFIGLAEILREEAERELHDPSAVRRQLEEAASAEAAGVVSEDELSRVQYEAVGRLIGQPADAPPADDRNGGKE
ncbi:MAG TPA: gas vesicle protein GvpG [Streptosporangiaceae bacterium]|jgi:hypothetical protein